MKAVLPSFVAALITKTRRSLIKLVGFCVFLSKKTIKIAFVTHYNYNSDAIVLVSLYCSFRSKHCMPDVPLTASDSVQPSLESGREYGTIPRWKMLRNNWD